MTTGQPKGLWLQWVWQAPAAVLVWALLAAAQLERRPLLAGWPIMDTDDLVLTCQGNLLAVG